LLAQRGSALGVAAFPDVHPDGLDNADRIEAGVLEEALVLGRNDGVAQHLRDVGVLHQAALFAILVEKVGDQLGLEQVLGSFGIVAQADDLGNTIAGELDHAALGLEIGIRAGIDVNLVGLQGVVAEPVLVRLAVSAAPQLRGDLLRVDLLADVYGARRRKQHGSVGKGAGRQFLVDEPRVLDVEPDEHTQADGREDRQRGDECPSPWAQDEAHQKCAPRYLYFYGHSDTHSRTAGGRQPG
jgi:hypothetical protein